MMRWHSTLCTGWSSLRFLPCSFPRPEKDRTPSLNRWQGLLLMHQLMPEFWVENFSEKLGESEARVWSVRAPGEEEAGGEEEAP